MTSRSTGPADDAPHPPAWFVGRVSVLATAGAALWGPDAKGVLLTGMPGSGKTACALELAARHRSAFEHLVWFQVPSSGASSAAEQLELFGSALESRIPECRLAGLTADPAALSTAGAAAADHPAVISRPRYTGCRRRS